MSRNKLVEPLAFQVWFEYKVFLLLNRLSYQSLRNNLPIAGEGIIKLIPLKRVLAIYGIQTTSFRIFEVVSTRFWKLSTGIYSRNTYTRSFKLRDGRSTMQTCRFNKPPNCLIGNSSGKFVAWATQWPIL